MKQVPPGSGFPARASAHLLKEFPAVGVVIVSKVHDSQVPGGGGSFSPQQHPSAPGQSRALFRLAATPRDEPAVTLRTVGLGGKDRQVCEGGQGSQQS